MLDAQCLNRDRFAEPWPCDATVCIVLVAGLAAFMQTCETFRLRRPAVTIHDIPDELEEIEALSP